MANLTKVAEILAKRNRWQKIADLMNNPPEKKAPEEDPRDNVILGLRAEIEGLNGKLSEIDELKKENELVRKENETLKIKTEKMETKEKFTFSDLINKFFPNGEDAANN